MKGEEASRSFDCRSQIANGRGKIVGASLVGASAEERQASASWRTLASTDAIEVAGNAQKTIFW